MNQGSSGCVKFLLQLKLHLFTISFLPYTSCNVPTYSHLQYKYNYSFDIVIEANKCTNLKQDTIDLAKPKSRAPLVNNENNPTCEANQ